MASTIPIWIGQRPSAVCKTFKKDLVLQPWQMAIHIDFRFERVWCVRDGGSILLTDGSTFPFTRVYANGKCLCGSPDPKQSGLDYSEDSKTFKLAIQDRMCIKCGDAPKMKDSPWCDRCWHIETGKDVHVTCFQCGDGHTPLYCLNCAEDILKIKR